MVKHVLSTIVKINIGQKEKRMLVFTMIVLIKNNNLTMINMHVLF